MSSFRILAQVQADQTPSGEENGRGHPRYHPFIPSPSASAASSTVTVLTSSNDSTGLIPLLSARTAHRGRPRIQTHIPKAYPHASIQGVPNTNTSKHRLYNKTLKMTASRQKELNMLVATPQGPDFKQVKTPEFDLDIRTNETIQDEKVNDNDREEDSPANKVTFVGILPQVSYFQDKDISQGSGFDFVGKRTPSFLHSRDVSPTEL
uniref:(California timema) hypothetical protein n=1 Tax=Timema californicum TaxID=61474 RepID=A0A7R9PCJ7_TIMCA|nr:unnamed protein product [Timema californicum]